MSVFKTACLVCGLSSVGEAADFFGVNSSTIKHWWSGRRWPPQGVWSQLAALYDQIIQISEHALDTFDDEIDASSVQAIAEHEFGEPLPAHARDAAMAMFVLTRFGEL